jgi:hypothetical protein
MLKHGVAATDLRDQPSYSFLSPYYSRRGGEYPTIIRPGISSITHYRFVLLDLPSRHGFPTMPAPRRIEESCIDLSPRSGGKGKPVHGTYGLPSFPSIKIPVTIEWSPCHQTEAAGILKQYAILDSAPDAVRPRCLGFFESSTVGRIGFVFADRNFKAQLSLQDLLRFKAKPDAQTRGQLAHAVFDCVQRTWESTEGKCEFHLWKGGVRFLDTLHPSEIPISRVFLSELGPPIVSPMQSDGERLLYLPPQMWGKERGGSSGSVKNLGSEIRWSLGIILLEISDWRSFRDILSLKEDSSESDMSSAVSEVWKKLHSSRYVLKSPKVSQVVRFCLVEDDEGQISVPELCTRVKQMLQE